MVNLDQFEAKKNKFYENIEKKEEELKNTLEKNKEKSYAVMKKASININDINELNTALQDINKNIKSISAVADVKSNARILENKLKYLKDKLNTISSDTDQLKSQASFVEKELDELYEKMETFYDNTKIGE
ncbi:MAG TPA: hypothetical protein DCE23_05295 [Firmicutes bacterium]|nr:hypothetical protein [Bacillota bacterium]